MLNSSNIKPMSINEMILALDRMTRFKFPETKLKRVYTETICKHFLIQKIKKNEIENYDNKSLRTLFEDIWNFSIKYSFNKLSKDFSLNKIFLEEEKKCFITNKDILTLYPLHADFKTLLENIKEIPNNFDNYKSPKKLILTEGITEEILLPEFSKINGCNFEQNNIIIEAIGGKSRILNQYRIYKKQLKIPMYILLDLDAKPIFDQINVELQKTDKSHLISSGEIEDIIPIKIFKTAINSEFKIQTKISIKDFNKAIGNVENLHNIFKENQLGEFKKAKMAHYIKNILTETTKLSDELILILDEIKAL